MRSADYVIKRILFAIVTVVRRDHAQLRPLPRDAGDAVDALRCRQCSPEFKEIQRQELGLDKSTWEQYRLYVTGLLHGDLGQSLRTQKEVETSSGSRSRTRCR